MDLDIETEEEQEQGWCKEVRCEPLGADTDSPVSGDEDDQHGHGHGHSLDYNVNDDEQEVLSSSLFSITSHLAQVQFRLRQIVEAPPEDKEKMLKSLEEFTLRGVPELGTVVPQPENRENRSRDKRRTAFVEKLKRQLAELECVREEEKGAKRDLIVREIRSGMEEWVRDSGSFEDIQHFCGERMPSDPALLASRLQAQVEDMQRFVDFLKSSPSVLPELKSNASTNVVEKIEENKAAKKRRVSDDDIRAETVNLMRKIVALMHIFSVSQFGCSSDPFKSTVVKTTPPQRWGDLRSRLDMSIDAVLELVKRAELRFHTFDNYDSDSEENTISLRDVPLTTAVRKHLALNIRDLMQHGLINVSNVGAVAPFVGCFPMRRNSNSNKPHAWDLILKYYQLNNGESYNSTPARKLSQSFNLDIVGGTAISNKQSMLSAIGGIIASHAPYKRSADSHFKAFVCAGLNAKKLVAWLNLIFKNKIVMQMCYSATSYVANTGFQDGLQSLDRLTPYKFDLPVDLAVRQFQNIKDVFM